MTGNFRLYTGLMNIQGTDELFCPFCAAASVLWLCQHGADTSLVKDDGWKETALHYAAVRGHTECCQVLLAFGADLEAKNYAGGSSTCLPWYCSAVPSYQLPANRSLCCRHRIMQVCIIVLVGASARVFSLLVAGSCSAMLRFEPVRH